MLIQEYSFRFQNCVHFDAFRVHAASVASFAFTAAFLLCTHVSAARGSFYDHKMCLEFQDCNEILIVLAL